MEAEPAVQGGWEAAVDPVLAARLLRPAVRPGVSDPAHGKSLAARLQRMAAPTLADDVARRYGSTALDAERPPVVYAAPPIQSAPREPRRGGPGPSVPQREVSQAERPVVRASERTTGPLFPPPRPLDSGPVQRKSDPAAVVQRRVDPSAAVQRRADPAAAVQRKADPAAAMRRVAEPVAVPVAIARRIATGPVDGAATASGEPRPAEIAIPSRAVVAPAPTRLQRQIAAEHAEAVRSAAPAPPLVHAVQVAGGGGAVGGAPMPAAAGASGSVGRADVVQRRIDPAASHPPPAAGPAAEAEGTPAVPPLIIAARGDASAGSGMVAAGQSAAGTGAARTAGGMDVVQRRIDPAASYPSPLPEPATAAEGSLDVPPLIVLSAPDGEWAGSGTAAASHPAALPVTAPGPAVGGGGTRGGPIQAMRVRPSQPWSPRGGGGAGGDGSSGGRTAAARSGGAGTAVQRMALPGDAGAVRGAPATRLVHAAPTVVVQRDATTGPPAEAPPKLPTATAQDADAGRDCGCDVPRLAEQVYGLLVRRLEMERKQRGW
ncbi:MAG TPA: hypothetical protein VFQ45_07275 [Longimicrobium sp.]|nr:hypothetical protein [Longimicrobium sp.]